MIGFRCLVADARVVREGLAPGAFVEGLPDSIGAFEKALVGVEWARLEERVGPLRAGAAVEEELVSVLGREGVDVLCEGVGGHGETGLP